MVSWFRYMPDQYLFSRSRTSNSPSSLLKLYALYSKSIYKLYATNLREKIKMIMLHIRLHPSRMPFLCPAHADSDLIHSSSGMYGFFPRFSLISLCFQYSSSGWEVSLFCQSKCCVRYC